MISKTENGVRTANRNRTVRTDLFLALNGKPKMRHGERNIASHTSLIFIITDSSVLRFTAF